MSRNRTIVGLKFKTSPHLRVKMGGSQSHHSGIETERCRPHTSQSWGSQSHHSGIETTKIYVTPLTPPPRFQSHHSGIETFQPGSLELFVTKSQSYHSGIETFKRAAATEESKPRRNRTIVGLKWMGLCMLSAFAQGAVDLTLG